MNSTELNSIAQAMVAPNKGILAADESTPTISKRFKDIDTESTEANRQTYRNMLFTSPGVPDYISGVILFDETIRQTNNEGVPIPEYLASLGIVPGIKVDKGAKELAACSGETVTEGLDGLERWMKMMDERPACKKGVAVPIDIVELMKKQKSEKEFFLLIRSILLSPSSDCSVITPTFISSRLVCESWALLKTLFPNSSTTSINSC